MMAGMSKKEHDGTPNIPMLLTLLALVCPAQAQTLDHALEQAWARHPQAAALAARADEAKARAEIASAFTPAPASLSLSSLNDRLTRNRGKHEWEAEVAMPLWLPGQQAARQAEAESAAAQVAARRSALRLELAGELREAWWAVAAARNTRDLAERRVESARGLEGDVLRRYQAGDLPRIDANLAQGERLLAEADALEAEAGLLAAEQAWRNLTGTPAPAVLPEESAAMPQEPVEDHPRLVAAAAAARTARSRQRVAEETRRDAPEFALRVVRERGEFSEPYANVIGVKLTIPLSSGPRVRQESAAARAETSQADAELALARLKLQLDTEKARRDLAAAERQFAMASLRRELSADTLRLSEKAFSLGESDLTTLLRVRAGAFEAQAFLNRQEVARAAAQSRLKQVLGVMP